MRRSSLRSSSAPTVSLATTRTFDIRSPPRSESSRMILRRRVLPGPRGRPLRSLNGWGGRGRAQCGWRFTNCAISTAAAMNTNEPSRPQTPNGMPSTPSIRTTSASHTTNVIAMMYITTTDTAVWSVVKWDDTGALALGSDDSRPCTLTAPGFHDPGARRDAAALPARRERDPDPLVQRHGGRRAAPAAAASRHRRARRPRHADAAPPDRADRSGDVARAVAPDPGHRPRGLLDVAADAAVPRARHGAGARHGLPHLLQVRG